MQNSPKVKKEAIDKLFRRNDLRGIYGKEINEELAFCLAKAIVSHFMCKKIIVGYDMRSSSFSLSRAIIKGINEQGADAVVIGMVDTPALYFASIKMNLPAVMITASHNPADYNGIKIVDRGSEALTDTNGLPSIKKIFQNESFIAVKKKGKIIAKDISKDYADYVLSFVKKKEIFNLRIVIDAGNGMGGVVSKKIFSKLNVEIVPLYFEPDGTFPNHIPNPAIYETTYDLRQRVVKERADIGIAFDGDMDRVFFVDELGTLSTASVTGALLMSYLPHKRNDSIVYNAICSRIVPETAAKLGLKAYKEKVGHSYMKARMRSTKSFFGLEHSGHFYFKKNMYADSGIIAALVMCWITSIEKQKGKSLSNILAPLRKYVQSEEISIKVKNRESVMKYLKSYYEKKCKSIDFVEGITINFEDGTINVRPSTNEEDLLRVNIESLNQTEMKRKKDDVIKLIRRFS